MTAFYAIKSLLKKKCFISYTCLLLLWAITCHVTTIHACLTPPCSTPSMYLLSSVTRMPTFL